MKQEIRREILTELLIRKDNKISEKAQSLLNILFKGELE